MSNNLLLKPLLKLNLNRVNPKSHSSLSYENRQIVLFKNSARSSEVDSEELGKLFVRRTKQGT